jgi:tetratricopeptide (TPR) repeat protein
LGQREEALEATREAAEIHRKLAEARPEAFLPDLAGSLNNLGNRYGELGQREKALEATREAAEIYRRLAEARPEAFLPDLAGSLNNLGNRYSESGQREKAIPLLEEALDTLWPFFERHPTAFWRTVLLIFRGLINTFESPDRQLRQHHRQHLEKLRNFVSAMDPPAKP